METYIIHEKDCDLCYSFKRTAKGASIFKCSSNAKGMIKEVNVPSSVDDIKVVSIEKDTFAEIDTELFVLPKGKYSLCCESLSHLHAKKLIWPKSLSKIPDYCFKCASINEIEFENVESIKSIGVGVFFHMQRLKRLDWAPRITEIPLDCFERSSIEELSGTEKIETIRAHAFLDSEFSEFNFPNLKTIGISAFQGCKHLRKVDIPLSCKELETKCFQDCSELTEISHTLNLKTIGSYAFSGTGIKSFIWPDGINEIPEGCFQDSNLEEISNISHVKSIQYWAFYNSRLKEITLPPSVDSVERHVFAKTLIQSIILPDKCKYISNRAFAECPCLTKIAVESSSSDICIELDAFLYNVQRIDIYLPNAEQIIFYGEYFSNIECDAEPSKGGTLLTLTDKGQNNVVTELMLYHSFESIIEMR